MTVEKLKSRTRDDLATMARRYAVPGWRAMRKDQLIKAILKALPTSKTSKKSQLARRTSKSSANRATRKSNGSNGHRKSNGKANGHTLKSAEVAKRTHAQGQAGRPSILARTFRNHSSRILKAAVDQLHGPDKLVAEAHDSYWIHARWSLSQHTMQRAEAALGFEWRQAIPILRVFDVTTGDSDVIVSNWVRDVEIHGEVQSWFVPVEGAPRSYRLEIGYLSPSNQLFVLARSNVVKTPRPGTMAHRNGSSSHASSNGNAQKQNGHVRPKATSTHNGVKSRNGSNGHLHGSLNGVGETPWHGDFPFEVHTELVVHGTTHPNAKMTLLGEEIALEADGSFSLRIALPDGRQVIPAVAVTPNGAEKRTIVLGVERNTRELEPQNLNEPN